VTVDFADIGVSTGYGKTVGWEFVAGRDFSRQLNDSNALVVNEAAVQYMGLKDPVGKSVKLWDNQCRIIGVIRNMVMESPYEPVKQTIYYLNKDAYDYVNIRINPAVSPHEAIAKIQGVCKVYAPAEPFSYRFVDDDYAIKFAEEERVGRLASVFAALAIFISCLGLFGMASFMAEQRIREIGIRKVLGASVYSLWRLLCTDFVVLVGIALVIALPLAWYFMHTWLQHYSYRTPMAWWVFAVAGAGAMVITLLTVSYQAVRAALVNPVGSLRRE
jgi:ABC-type antimicrobial peptide transport system permease subunit